MLDSQTLKRLRSFAVAQGRKGSGEIIDAKGNVFARFSTMENAIAALSHLADNPIDWTPTSRDTETLKDARRLLELQTRQRQRL